MTFDVSRFSFHPFKDFFGVVMQQGRVQLDADWNEWGAELARRLQAGALDTFGGSVVPRTTPGGFEILATAGALTIGAGRMYVDGLLAENHGGPPLAWDPVLAELSGTAPMPFFEQPHLPFNPSARPAPADVFNRPAIAGGPHLVYLDVWQREVTHIQEPELVEKAVGVDTTARLQTVWQVRVLPNVGNVSCTTPDGEIPGWAAVIRPSGARLTTSTGDVPGDPNPCEAPPAAGYKGLENQLYRVEIHRGGPQGTATFKWSRDNGSVAARVSEIHGGTRLVVESLGRDDVLGFHPGDWIEVLDDWHELHGRPGLLRRIRPGDGVETTTRSILIEEALPAGLFPVDAQNRTDATRHTRIRRWDQQRQVKRADGTVFHDLDASASSDGIPVPPAGTPLSLENGILVDFGLTAPGEFRTGDYWVFAARVVDGTVEILDQAPPRGIHHHYARLALVTLPDVEHDCRVLWPPQATGQGCDCTACVTPEGHNAGTATIQQAIDAIRARGGTICLEGGVYRLDAPLVLDGVQSLRIRGQGWRTLLQAGIAGPVVRIQQALGVAIENLSVLGVAAGSGTTAMISAVNCVDLDLRHLVVVAIGAGDATAAAVGLSGLALGAAVRECALVAGRGVVGGTVDGTIESQRPYLLTANLRVTDNALLCRRTGVSLTGIALHSGLVRLADNLVLGCDEAGIVATGGALPAASVTIAGNVLHVTGTGVQAGVDGARISDNEIVGTGRAGADGIALVTGLDPGPLDHVHLTGNRIRGVGGHGIAIRRALGQAMIKSNVLERIERGGLVMERDAGAAYLDIEDNHFADLGLGFNDQGQPYVGVQLIRAARADFTANVLAGVARQAIASPLRAGLLAAASGELRVAGNRMFGVGPERFAGETIAIAVDAAVRQFVADDNALARVADETEAPAPDAWLAVVLDALASRGAGAAGAAGGATTAPGVVTLSLSSDRYLYLSAFRVELLARARGSASLRGNRLRGRATTAPLVDVNGNVGCIFAENDGELSDDHSIAPVGRIRGAHVNAANNRLIGVGERTTLELFAEQFAVLGNLTTGPITVNGQLLQAPSPWALLNVTV